MRGGGYSLVDFISFSEWRPISTHLPGDGFRLRCLNVHLYDVRRILLSIVWHIRILCFMDVLRGVSDCASSSTAGTRAVADPHQSSTEQT